MNVKQTESAVERELSIFQKTELAAKLAGACIPLTYISGYLIVTSYLGTYALVLNSGDLFRAKYIYVGFEYLMFMTLVAAAFSIVARAVELVALILREYQNTPSPQEKKQQQQKAYDVLLSRAEPDNALMEKFRKLRGDFVVGLVVLVFALEIIFLNPENLGGILPRQVLYLTSVALYQFTYYRELHEPYQWGLVFGQRWVEDLRWSLLLAQACAAGAILCRIALNVMDAHGVSSGWRWATYWFGWVFVVLAVEIDALGGISIFARSRRLCRLDQDSYFNPATMAETQSVGKLILGSIWGLRSLKGLVVGYFKFYRIWIILVRGIPLVTPLGLMLFFIYHQVEHSYWSVLERQFIGASFRVWINLALEVLPLFLSLLVLGNVSLLTSMFALRDRRLRQGRIHSPRLRTAATAKNGPHERFVRYTRRAILAATLYIASVLGFGYIVYPFIPVQKSGGNYSVRAAPRVCVRLVKQTPLLSCPGSLLPQLGPNEALVPLEEDSDSIYLARDTENGGPSEWRWGNVKGYKRPRIYAITRKCVAGVVDALPEAKQDRCPKDEAD